MAKNRYGRIYHSDHRHINLRFPSVDARREFAEKFQAYHSEHDHDGEAPRFEDITAQQAGSTTYESGKLHDAHSVTIDGYATYEIEEYHEDEKHTYYYRYKPPTCCVPPLISIKRKLVDSATLQRHELSAIFGDMPDDDYQSLLASVEKDGFIDNVVRLYQGQILDGWHRYSVAKQLNLLRKLRFTQWHEAEHRDGDPRVFVYARNMERRHQDKAVRAQIAVTFNKRFGMGRPKGGEDDAEKVHQNDELKSREELAKEVGVSTATIDRAIAIEKQGESEAVISGDKTAGEVIKARDAATAKKRKKQVLKNMWDKRKQVATDYVGEGDTDLNQYLSLSELEKGFAKTYESHYDESFTSGIQRIDRAHSFKDFVDRAFEVDEFGVAKVDISELEEELKAISAYAHDILVWQRSDWSPDTNWILPLIEAKKQKAKKPEPEDTVDSLWERITPAISAWKAERKGQGMGHASKTMFISAIKRFDAELSRDSETDVVLLKKLLNVLTELHGPVHTFERYIKTQLDGASLWSEDDDAEKAGALEKFRHQKRDLYIRIHETPLLGMKDEFGNINSDKALHKVMLAAYSAYGLPEELLWSEQAVEALSADEISTLTGKYFLFAQDLVSESHADWVAELYQELDSNSTAGKDKPDEDQSLNDRMDRCRADLLQVWQQEDVYTWEGLEIGLYVEEYGLGVDVIQGMQKKIAAEHPKPTSPTDAGCEVIEVTDTDTSLAEIDNLPAVKYFLESLQKQVGTVEHPATRDDLSCVIFEAFTEQFEGVTEREQLSILIDVALNIVVSESM